MTDRFAVVVLLLSLASCAAHGPEARPDTTAAAAPVAAAAPAAPGAGPASTVRTAEGRGFTVPIPIGFGQIRKGVNEQIDGVMENGGVVLAEVKRPELEGAFQASMVIALIPVLDIDPSNEAACAGVAGQSSGMVGAEVLTSKVVTLKVGKTCQWDLKATGSSVRGGRGTIIPGPTAWMVVCNYDVRDRPAQEGCDMVVNGFEFSPRP